MVYFTVIEFVVVIFFSLRCCKISIINSNLYCKISN